MNSVTLIWWIQVLFLIQWMACGVISQSSNSTGNSTTRCKADSKEPWNYREGNGLTGPSSWGSKFGFCSGHTQSPIDVNTNKVVLDKKLYKLTFHGYDIPVASANIQNNGRTIQVIPQDKVQRTIFVNSTTYTLAEVHFHWDHSNNSGSEHTIGGKQYSMEAHFVHKSVTHKIAVVAVFLQEQNNVVNEALRIISSNLTRVTYKDQKMKLNSSLSLNHLLPGNPSSFYRYLGSLTTPECNEGVIWSLLIKPVQVGVNQMAEFRKLHSAKKSESGSSCQLTGNHRPVQPLNSRTVSVSQ